MDTLREFIRRYRRMTNYRDGEYRQEYNRDCLKKFVSFTFLIAFVLGVDLLTYALLGNSSTGTSLEALKLVVGCLLASGVVSVAALHRGISPWLQELGRGVALLIMLGFYLYVIFFELQFSGGLYIYVISLLIFGGVIHLRMRENFLVVLGADLVVLYAHLAKHVTIAEGQIYLSPERMLTFCSLSAIILALWRNYEYLSLVLQRAKLRRISELDALTGLLNRRGMENKIRHSKVRGQVCAAIFDIDDFKKYNDTYGHAAGDACLRLVAGILQKAAQAHHGVAVRYGGEEMVLLFFTGKQDRVRGIINGLLKELRAMKKPSGRNAEHDILTMSCGLVSAKGDLGQNAEAYYGLIAEADKNLYVAKKCGKDCVIG